MINCMYITVNYLSFQMIHNSGRTHPHFLREAGDFLLELLCFPNFTHFGGLRFHRKTVTINLSTTPLNPTVIRRHLIGQKWSYKL